MGYGQSKRTPICCSKADFLAQDPGPDFVDLCDSQSAWPPLIRPDLIEGELEFHGRPRFSVMDWNCCSSICRSIRVDPAAWSDPTRHQEPQSTTPRLPFVVQGYSLR